jgi:transketolase
MPYAIFLLLIQYSKLSICRIGLVLSGLLSILDTFLFFSDYMRPAIRLAAIMRTKVIHRITHDSIGVGENGPTHQPIEHLATLELNL